jgi:hypothetical protein
VCVCVCVWVSVCVCVCLSVGVSTLSARLDSVPQMRYFSFGKKIDLLVYRYVLDASFNYCASLRWAQEHKFCDYKNTESDTQGVCGKLQKIYIMREKKVCVCVCLCVKNKYHDCGPPWTIWMITKMQSERHIVFVYIITKIQRTMGTKNYGLLVNIILFHCCGVPSCSSGFFLWGGLACGVFPSFFLFDWWFPLLILVRNLAWG